MVIKDDHWVTSLYSIEIILIFILVDFQIGLYEEKKKQSLETGASIAFLCSSSFIVRYFYIRCAFVWFW